MSANSGSFSIYYTKVRALVVVDILVLAFFFTWSSISLSVNPISFSCCRVGACCCCCCCCCSGLLPIKSGLISDGRLTGPLAPRLLLLLLLLLEAMPPTPSLNFPAFVEATAGILLEGAADDLPILEGAADDLPTTAEDDDVAG